MAIAARARPESGTGAEPRLAVVLTGVSGAGKTTVAGILAARLGWARIEADELQPAVNVAKIRARIPLTDADRRPWLANLRRWIDRGDTSMVISCSALRRRYREALLSCRTPVRFVELDGDFALIWPRLGRRVGTMMTATMLVSQIAARETVVADEISARVWVDADAETVADRVQALIEGWRAELAGGAG